MTTAARQAIARLNSAIKYAEAAQCECKPGTEKWLDWESEARACRDRIDRIRNGNDKVCRQGAAVTPTKYRPYHSREG